MKLRHVRGQDIRRHPSNWRKLERERERLRGGRQGNEEGGEEKNKRGRGEKARAFVSREWN